MLNRLAKIPKIKNKKAHMRSGNILRFPALLFSDVIKNLRWIYLGSEK